MAAPSLGRRSWYYPLSGKIRATALIAQSRRWVYGRVKGLLYDGFFLCRRTAVVEAFGVQYKFNDLLNSQTMADTLSGKAIYTVE